MADTETATPPAPVNINASSGQPDQNLVVNGSNETEANGTAEAEALGQATEEEHPDAHEIRRQVEYYFSDENLPTDLHLLQCCNGRENVPVSLSRVCGFKKMRGFKPRGMVIAALRKSTFLEISQDGKTIKRKVPLVGKCLLDEDYNNEFNDDEIAYDPRTKRAIQHPVPLLPQEKKVYPPGTSKNMSKPTGFEETYVEGPLAPAEAEEEMAMYDPDKPFVERIEIAIQRFKQKRRMHEMYSKIFNKWMKFGGVDSEPRMFGAVSQQEMKQMSAEEIARATATHHVPWDRGEPKKWAVDFLGVGEAFLSSFFPANYGHSPQGVKTACQVLRSFYNYLMFHQVCEEYREQLLLARALCDKAEQELPQVYRAGNALPGAFNMAASTILGGSYAGSYAGTSDWALESGVDELGVGGIGMRKEEAMATFKIGVAVHGTDEQFDNLDMAGPQLWGLGFVKSESVSLDVVTIHYPSDDVKEAYETQNNDRAVKRKISLQPLGKLVCKYWPMPEYKKYDLPKDKYPQGRLPKPDANKEYELWVEEDILKECFVGMKMDATVLALNGGILILDEVKEVFCSFYKWLPNELCANRRPPTMRLVQKAMGPDDWDGEDGKHGEGRQMEQDELSDDYDE